MNTQHLLLLLCQAGHDVNMSLLCESERPFSFYEREKERAAAREAARRAAKDPDRFQVRVWAVKGGGC